LLIRLRSVRPEAAMARSTPAQAAAASGRPHTATGRPVRRPSPPLSLTAGGAGTSGGRVEGGRGEGECVGGGHRLTRGARAGAGPRRGGRPHRSEVAGARGARRGGGGPARWRYPLGGRGEGERGLGLPRRRGEQGQPLQRLARLGPRGPAATRPQEG